MENMYYSKSTRGFYCEEINGDNIPSDAVPITLEEHVALLYGESQGKSIRADAEGRPYLSDEPSIVLTYAQKRVGEYPPIEDYIDGVVKGDQQQIDNYIAACLAVKAKYPKG